MLASAGGEWRADVAMNPTTSAYDDYAAEYAA
jgi:hypothetical protein